MKTAYISSYFAFRPAFHRTRSGVQAAVFRSMENSLDVDDVSHYYSRLPWPDPEWPSSIKSWRFACQALRQLKISASNLDNLVKSHEFNYRWLSKKVHIQGVVFFQERGHTCSMPSVWKILQRSRWDFLRRHQSSLRHEVAYLQTVQRRLIAFDWTQRPVVAILWKYALMVHPWWV